MNFAGLLRGTAVAALTLTIFSTAARAQDKIRTLNGEEINGKVVEVSPRTLTYRKNADGPTYTIPRRDVVSVYYGASQHTETYREERGMGRRESDNAGVYGNTILSIAPVHMTQLSAKGFGISIERVLDKRGMVSFYMPVAMSLGVRNNTYYYTSYPTVTERTNYYFMYPGARIYPTGSRGVVRYSVGPSIGLGFGRDKYTRGEEVYNPITKVYETQYVKHDDAVFQSGILINNAVNFQPTPSLHMGIELGLGYMYTNNRYNEYGDNPPMVQFSFSMGYRF